jgi:hypothetical protein
VKKTQKRTENPAHPLPKDESPLRGRNLLERDSVGASDAWRFLPLDRASADPTTLKPAATAAAAGPPADIDGPGLAVKTVEVPAEVPPKGNTVEVAVEVEVEVEASAEPEVGVVVGAEAPKEPEVPGMEVELEVEVPDEAEVEAEVEEEVHVPVEAEMNRPWEAELLPAVIEREDELQVILC